MLVSGGPSAGPRLLQEIANPASRLARATVDSICSIRNGKNVGSPISRVLCVIAAFAATMMVIYLRAQLLAPLSNLPEGHPSRTSSRGRSTRG